MINSELSNKNSQESTKGVILEDTRQVIGEAKDEVKLYVGSGRYNKRNGTVDLTSVLGRSRFRYKR